MIARPEILISDRKTFLAKDIIHIGSIDNKALLLDSSCGKIFSLDYTQLEVVQALKTPADLNTLTARLVSIGWDTSGLDDLPSIVEDLLENECLVILDRFFREKPFDAQEEEGKSLKYITWPTKNRPNELRQALPAWRDVYIRGGNGPAFIIADDSDSDRKLVEDVVREFASIAMPANVFYFNKNARKKFADLFASGFKEILYFVLDINLSARINLLSYGANQNFIALLSAGEQVLLTDDDIFPEFKTLSANKEEIRYSSSGDSSRKIIVPDWSDFSNFGRSAEINEYLGEFKYLGKSGLYLTQGNGTLDLSSCDYKNLEKHSSGSSYAAALCHFYWGDSGMGSASYLLNDRMGIEAGITDSAEYEKLMRERLVFRGLDMTTVGGKVFMGGHIILNPRTYLPPFSPLSRNLDALWGATLEYFHPDTFIVYSKVSVMHKPLVPRFSNRERATRWALGLNETIQLLLGFLYSSMNPSDNAYGQLGTALENFVSGCKGKVREVLLDIIAKAIAGRRELIAENIRYFGSEPEWWAEDAFAAMEWLDNYLFLPESWLPWEFRGRENEFLEYCANFGRMLQAWPEIYENAKIISPDFLEKYRLK